MGCGASNENVEKKQFLFRVRLIGGLNLYNNSFGVQLPGTYTSAGRFDGRSDPYCTIQCTGTNKVCTSKTILHEQNPVWNEEFYFNTSTNAPILTITVKDKDIASGDDVIGTAKVNLHGLITKQKEREMWLPLEGSKAKGEVGLAVIEAFRMHITAKQGVDVQPMDTLSGSSDVYMTMQVGQQAVQKTTTKKWTLNPVWNETFTVFIPYGVKSQLAMILYDHDSVGTDNNMGWHYHYFNGTPETPGTARALDTPITNAKGTLQFSLTDDITQEGVTDAGAVSEDVKKKWPSPKPLGCTVEVRVLGAFNLAVADYNVAGDLASLASSEVYHEFKEYTGSSDPFARVTCEGVTYDTRHINKTLEPTWNEKFRFVVNNREESQLMVEVLDSDLVVNDSIGCVKIPIKNLKPGRRQEIWSFLDRGRGEVGVEVTQHHQLHVRVVAGKDLPAKDMNGMCDPYVKLSLAGQSYQTRVVHNDRNPWYEEDFRWCVPTLQHLKLQFEVWDSDLMIFKKGLSEDLIGNAELDVSALVPGMPNEFTLKLNIAGKEVPGELRVIITEEVPLPEKMLDALMNKGKEAFDAMVKTLSNPTELVACLKMPDFDKKEEAKFEVADPKLAPRPRFGKIDVEVVAVRGMRTCSEPFSVGVALPQQGKRYKTKEHREPRGKDIGEHFTFPVPSRVTGSLEFKIFESSKHDYLNWTNECYGRQIIHFRDVNGGEGLIRGAKPDDEWLKLGDGSLGQVVVRIREMYRYQVRVISAKGIKVDKDPFIRVKHEKEVRQTSYVSSNPQKDRTTGVPGAPVWDEQFTLFSNDKGIIEFQLVDVGILNDTYLAKAEFDLANLRRGVLHRVDLPLGTGGTLTVELLEEEKMALIDKIIDAAANTKRLAEALAAELADAAKGAAGAAADAVTGAATALTGALGKLF